MKKPALVTKIAALVAVSAGTAAAIALPAGADVGILSPPVAAVQVGSSAILDAKGAVIAVPVTVVCAPGGSGTLSVSVTQTVGQDIARGSAFVDTGACTGRFQTIDLKVIAFTNPFRRGAAFALAEFNVCDFSGCLPTQDQREIRIQR